MNHGHQFDEALSTERKAEQERKQAEREANVRLRAAAPDLLAACEDGIKYLNACGSGIGLTSEKQNKAAFRKILTKAIEKAK